MLLVYRHIIRYCSLLIIAFSMIGCAADNFSADTEKDDVVPGDLVVSINVSIEGDVSSRSRSEEDEVRIPGTDNENKLSHGHLFIQNLDTNGNPVNGQTMYYVKVSLNTGENKFTLKNIDFGKKRIYIAANLSDEQASHFTKNADDGYQIPQAQNNGYKLSGEFVSEKGIAMFCTEAQELDFLENKLYVLDKPFYLKRLVAKVHVTATTSKENEIEYCNLAGDMSGIGWIRLSNVKYLVNGLNTKTYLMQKYAQSTLTIPEDPNFNIEGNISIVDDNIDPINWTDFYFNSINNISDYGESFADTEKYDASRIPESNTDQVKKPYTRGLYCPENSFVLPTGEKLNAFKDYKSDAWPMVTHVVVSAKFTPKKIVVEKELSEWIKTPGNISIDEDVRDEIIYEINTSPVIDDPMKSLCTIECLSEEVAEAVLLSSLKKENYLKDESSLKGLPRGTFFWNNIDSEKYAKVFTYGAVKKFSGKVDNTDLFDQFATVPAGVGYYYIYLDNTNSTTGDESYPRKNPENSIVERNAYYLVNIRSFSGPGDATLKGDNILVNTIRTDWKEGGNAEIELQ